MDVYCHWRDLPLDLQKEYMQASFYLGGGKTGMARRLSLDTPSLTLTCAPAQKQTERCHPEETRPLQTREYPRIQTFLLMSGHFVVLQAQSISKLVTRFPSI